MTVDNKKAKRKPGGGRKKSKPDYNPSAILQNQIEQAVALYRTEEHPSLQTIANELDLNSIKVRKLLITAGVYKSDVADQVNRVFNKHRASGLLHTEAIAATMRELNLSIASVTSYLPYEKGVYFPAETDSSNISVGAERIRRMRKREKILEELRIEQSEEALWAAVIEFQGYKFRTYSGLVFSYSLKKGRCRGNTESGVVNKQDEACKQGGVYTKELFIDRRENSKSLAWSSVLLAYHNIPQIGCVIDRPKALGDIRGVTYIYAIFYRFGLIDAPEKAKEKMELVRNKDSEQMSFV
ncbi:hypothetical protein ACTQ3O_11820 [Mediterraneibacter faecis]|uniref:hypothetical protein n=1 Tax=Mediterraneibacter faecis TaxID=592978 RepID=UPI003F981E7F